MTRPSLLPVAFLIGVSHGFIVQKPTSRTFYTQQQWSLRDSPSIIRRSFGYLRRILRYWFPDAQDSTAYNSENSTASNTPGTRKPPKGDRWAVTDRTDLSGTWCPIVTSDFKSQYNEYLTNCSQSALFRRVCLSVIGFTREEIHQTDDGRRLQIIGTTPAGNWARTLISSGTEFDQTTVVFEPINVTFKDPDNDDVWVESWWTKDGTVHKSWLRGKPRVCGGEFESTRFLLDGVLHCESRFHPNGAPSNFKPGAVMWRFQKEK